MLQWLSTRYTWTDLDNPPDTISAGLISPRGRRLSFLTPLALQAIPIIRSSSLSL